MYEEIMRKIQSGLTGNSEEDIPYLKQQMELYKNHELSQEIIRACGRLLADLMPLKDKESLNRALANDIASINATLDDIRFHMYKKEYVNALAMSENLVKRLEALGAFENDTVSEYYTFHEEFERILYCFYNKPTRTVRNAPIPMSTIYFYYGNLLFEMKRYEEARIALEKAMKWNPAGTAIAFEHSEIFKVTKDFETFANLTRNIFKYAFRSKDVARCYRNFGFYFVEKELYDVAAACYFMAHQYDPENPMATSELYYIQSQTGTQLKPPSSDEMKKYSEEYNIPLLASSDTISIAFSLGMQFIKAEKPESAVYFLNIVYDLTEDEKIKALINSLPHSNP